MKVGMLDFKRDTRDGVLTGSMLDNVTDTVEYNVFKELSRYSAQHASTVFFNIQYERDKLGRITKKTETVADGTIHVYAYVYNNSGYLEQVSKDGVVTALYSYDANGNRSSYSGIHGNKSGTYDEQDRMQSYGNAIYTYTPNGDLLTKTDASGTTEYEYNAIGSLIKVTRSDGAIIEYIVDGNNRRIGKKVNGVLVKTWMYESQLRPTAEYDGAGNLIARYVYGTKINVPEYILKDGIYYRIITDHLGSVRYVVDVSTGSIVQSMEYDEYGIVTHNSNPGFTPFGYAGGMYDHETGLVRFGARDYDAEIGRWTCKDPIGFEGKDINLYSYVGNNPVCYRDPNGLLAPLIGLGLGIIGIPAINNMDAIINYLINRFITSTETGSSECGSPHTVGEGSGPYDSLNTRFRDLLHESYHSSNPDSAFYENLGELSNMFGQGAW